MTRKLAWAIAYTPAAFLLAYTALALANGYFTCRSEHLPQCPKEWTHD